MPMSRTEKWVALFLAGLGLIPAAIGALWLFMSVTAVKLHPDAGDITSVAAAASDPSWTTAIDQGRHIVRGSLIDQNIPGVSVAVGVDREIVWAEGFGWADVEKRVPVSPATKFRIGTASAALTSAGVGLLVDSGRLKFDDEIQAHVPAFPKKPWPVTLRQVMAHVSGLHSDSGDEGPLFSRHCDRPVEALDVFAGDDLLFEPGTRFRNSRYGFILVSAAVEAASGEPFLMFMQKHVFDPLGMTDTQPDAAEPIPGRATPYFPRFAADPRYGLDPMRDLDLSCYAGASVFLSTPADLVRFAMSIENGLLQPATVAALRTSQRLTSGDETGFGLGWDLDSMAGRDGGTRSIVGHDGDVLGGITASLWTLPGEKISIAVLSNTSYADTRDLATRIAAVFAANRTLPASR